MFDKQISGEAIDSFAAFRNTDGRHSKDLLDYTDKVVKKEK